VPPAPSPKILKQAPKNPKPPCSQRRSGRPYEHGRDPLFSPLFLFPDSPHDRDLNNRAGVLSFPSPLLTQAGSGAGGLFWPPGYQQRPPFLSLSPPPLSRGDSACRTAAVSLALSTTGAPEDQQALFSGPAKMKSCVLVFLPLGPGAEKNVRNRCGPRPLLCRGGSKPPFFLSAACARRVQS